MSFRGVCYFIISILMLFTVNCRSGDWVSGRYWYFIDNIAKTEGGSPEILLWLALPTDHRGQRVEIVEIYPEPTEVLRDTINGNRIAFWRVTECGNEQHMYFYYDFRIRTEEVVTGVVPENIEPYDTTSAEYLRYTASEPWIEIGSEITARAVEAVDGETNPYLKARNIFDWVIANMTYEYPDMQSRGAARSITKLKGDCGEFSFVFAAMCRAVGIPARTVTCLWFQGGGHAWAEILLPPYGWVPVDASVGQALAPGGSKAFPNEKAVEGFMESRGISRKDPYYVFGNLYPKRMIVFIGTNVEAVSRETGVRRTFKFMQPGGLVAAPPAIEISGLWDKAVHTGLCIFGEQHDDVAYAMELVEKELAAAYMQVGLYEKAERGLLKKVAEKAEDAIAWLNLGQVYLNTNEYDKAITALHKCLEGKAGSIKPVIDQWAHNFLGNCFDMKGMRDSAMVEYRKVIDAGVNFQGAVDSAKRHLESPFSGGKADPAGGGNP